MQLRSWAPDMIDESRRDRASQRPPQPGARAPVARLRLSPLVCLAAGIAGAVCAASAQVDRAHPGSTRFFDIPSQPLASALEAYGHATGVQVLFESLSAVGRRSAPVRGDFTPNAALDRLLAGTDVEVRRLGPHAITLAAPAGSDASPPIDPLRSADLSLDPLRVRASTDNLARDQLRDYGNVVRSDIENALRKSARTRTGDYRVEVELWVDDSRRVRRARLARSTGDQERDAAVNASLRGLLISRDAPADMPRPMRVLVVVRSLR